MNILLKLEKIIEERAATDPSISWTAELISGGRKRCAQKFGEESVETVIAGVRGSKTEMIKETSDTLYHLLVLLRANDIKLSDVFEELENRQLRSGIAEKNNRKKS